MSLVQTINLHLLLVDLLRQSLNCLQVTRVQLGLLVQPSLQLLSLQTLDAVHSPDFGCRLRLYIIACRCLEHGLLWYLRLFNPTADPLHLLELAVQLFNPFLEQGVFQLVFGRHLVNDGLAGLLIEGYIACEYNDLLLESVDFRQESVLLPV